MFHCFLYQSIHLGKAPLGFIAPWLYSLTVGTDLTDITKGKNSGDITGGACLRMGFPATTGWDPVTGLGTPIYSGLLQAVAKLP